MPEDFYGDGGGSEGPTQESKGATETTLIPKSMCPGMEVGDSLEMKIVGSRGSEYEVEYTGANQEEPEAEPPAEMPMGQGGGPSGGMGMME